MESTQSKIDNLTVIRDNLFKEKEAIDRKILKNFKAISSLKEDLFLENMNDSSISIHDKLSLLLQEDHYISKVSHDYCLKFFKNELIGLSTGGYFPFSQQKSIQITLIKGIHCNLEDTYKSLNDILHVIKPFNDKGDKLFSLFEHTLSEFCSYNIKLSHDNLWSLVDGRERTLKSFDSLLDTLKYCQTHHYYKSSLPEDNIYED